MLRSDPSYERAAVEDPEVSSTNDFVVDPSRLSKNDRRRLWWRNAVISLFFIASWSVLCHVTQTFLDFRKVLLRYNFIRL